ncbi:unnamed protein product [Phyllotreta striolata]|uniref:Uncharacterized protein n=1 Tax=Phyllotreta striolata TaxID=444603 RepID=A0A9N9XP82_PHYSR|nr:unnamed protein product [Phyllotreta striolata]
MNSGPSKLVVQKPSMSHKNQQHAMNLGTLNIRGNITKKLDGIISEIKKMEMDIVVLTETRKKNNGIEEIDEYIHFYNDCCTSNNCSCGYFIGNRRTIPGHRPLPQRHQRHGGDHQVLGLLQAILRLGRPHPHAHRHTHSLLRARRRYQGQAHRRVRLRHRRHGLRLYQPAALHGQLHPVLWLRRRLLHRRPRLQHVLLLHAAELPGPAEGQAVLGAGAERRGHVAAEPVRSGDARRRRGHLPVGLHGPVERVGERLGRPVWRGAYCGGVRPAAGGAAARVQVEVRVYGRSVQSRRDVLSG